MSRAAPYLKLAALAAILAAAAVVVRTTAAGDLFSRTGLADLLSDLRRSMWAPLIFVGIYTGATAVALPGSILTIAGGAVFGFWWGALLNTVGANLGANAAFLLARALGRDGVTHIVGERLAKVDRVTAERGFAGLFVLRLIPLVPFNALNVGSGFTAIRWRDYALATVIGILPGTLVYTFFADALVRGSVEASLDAALRLWIAAGLLLVLSAVPLIARKLGFTAPANNSAEAS